MQKEALRKIYKQKRRALSQSQLQEFQENIYQQIFEYDFSSVTNIHIFLPIEKQFEINTYPIINFLRNKKKTIIISKSNFTNYTLQHFILEEQTVLKKNTYGIPEPVNAKEFSEKKIDLVFVPLLISDEKKYRVGYGKGFYDRFLATCSPTIKTIGLNFFAPIQEIEDKDPHDFPLDNIIYPK